jgi:tetratricopeptide (TPR) repeat protein
MILAVHPPQAGEPKAKPAELDALALRACALRDQARYGEAERLLRHVLALAEEGCQGCEWRVCSFENELGMLYKYTGRFDEAEQAYHRALAIADRAGGSRGSEMLANLYHNLGGLEHARDRYAAGEPFARRGLAIRERLLGPDHPDVAADLAALAPLLDGQGKRQEAAALMIRALGILERAYGPDNCELAVSLNNLAALRYREGNRNEALALYRHALAIKEKCLGPVHPDVATTLNNMAVLLKAQGDRHAAASLYRRALVIFEQSLGEAHPKTVACRENYARVAGR